MNEKKINAQLTEHNLRLIKIEKILFLGDKRKERRIEIVFQEYLKNRSKELSDERKGLIDKKQNLSFNAGQIAFCNELRGWVEKAHKK